MAEGVESAGQVKFFQYAKRTRGYKPAMQTEQINWLAVIVAAVSMFLVGGLWYSPLLFGKAWQRQNGFTDEQVAGFNKARSFGGSFVLALIMAANLAAFLAAPGTTLAWGITAGLLAGVGWVAAGIAMTALFEGRSWSYIAINAGYHIVAFALMGAIIGGWR